MFDAAIIGGGVMGCATALELAQGGMSVVVIEKRALCVGASGVNAGTLSLQIKRAALVPYALRGLELWRTTSARLGCDVHFRRTGGLTVAFTDEEAEILRERMSERKAAGVPLEIIAGDRANEIEPGLSTNVRLASWCAIDGYADSTATGRAYRRGLLAAGVTIREGAAVTGIERRPDGFTLRLGDETIAAGRIVLAGGAWLGAMGRLVGADFPVRWRVNQVSVTERMPRIVKVIVGHAYGLLTLKQSDNGTVLIGGGWQGRGDPDRGGAEIIPENLVGNLRLAVHAVPALRNTRIVRTWLGLEANVPDFMPLVGPVPGVENCYVIGAVRGGYTIGPCMGQLLGQSILGREPDLPLFNPGRFNTTRQDDRVVA